jgi:hypothetical protein
MGMDHGAGAQHGKKGDRKGRQASQGHDTL